MSNLYSLIYNTLLALAYPVTMQGDYTPDDDLPETFLTYQIIDTPSVSFADNKPTAKTSRVQVTLYSTDPIKTQAAETTIKSVMQPAKFLRIGGRDLPKDPTTGHSGYTCDYRFYEEES